MLQQTTSNQCRRRIVFYNGKMWYVFDRQDVKDNILFHNPRYCVVVMPGITHLGFQTGTVKHWR